jgi:hypothetical protein
MRSGSASLASVIKLEQHQSARLSAFFLAGSWARTFRSPGRAGGCPACAVGL